MMVVSGISLLYTAVVVPPQIFLWDYSESCNTFSSLFIDNVVDSFFLVMLCSNVLLKPSLSCSFVIASPVAPCSNLKHGHCQIPTVFFR
jgi:hypothetical protein